MIIEMLYPELSNLYGDSANIKYLQESHPETKIIETHLGDKPFFIDGKVDLVYRGTLTEHGQQLFIENAEPYVGGFKTAIERGQHFLVTGNAVELFGNYIIDKSGEKIDCLEFFDFHVERDIVAKRFNSLYVGTYADLKVVGFKSQFSQGFYDSEIPALFDTTRGPGTERFRQIRLQQLEHTIPDRRICFRLNLVLQLENRRPLLPRESQDAIKAAPTRIRLLGP